MVIEILKYWCILAVIVFAICTIVSAIVDDYKPPKFIAVILVAIIFPVVSVLIVGGLIQNWLAGRRETTSVLGYREKIEIEQKLLQSLQYKTAPMVIDGKIVHRTYVDFSDITQLINENRKKLRK